MADWLSGRPVLVCGVRLAGEAAARALLAHGARVQLCDREHTESVTPLEAQGAQFLGELDRLPEGVDLVVTSPGFRPDHPLLVSAAHAGVDVLGEVELAWRLRPADAAPWLAITGTNGKTTTVRMLESILRAAGHRALAVGNVGVSIIDAVLARQPYDVLAVELSSFQLHWSSTVIPAAGALLNLAPDHLDWHRSMSAYVSSKTRVWAGPIAIANLDDPNVAKLLPVDLTSGVAQRREKLDQQGKWVGFTLGRPVAGQLGVVDGVLVDRVFADAAPLVPAEQVHPAGPHNVANALAAAALARAHGVPSAAVADGLRDFVPDPHRNQFVAEHAGIKYVDDSKATNPHAAAASLSAYRPVVWIAGGQLKDAPVDDLVSACADRLQGVVLLGVDRAQIRGALARHAPEVPVIEVESHDDEAMTEVVQAAAGLARPGSTVLLAPAAASYDMFPGYAARGEAFAAAVRALGDG
jgi:UDP-N-acetylmuramoylalanine--D-glutamate ligase